MRVYLVFTILCRLCGGSTGIEEEPCLVPCSIDCQMSDWNEWGACSRLCGPGIHHRYRCVSNFFQSISIIIIIILFNNKTCF